MKRIEEDLEVYKSDGVDESTVYKGSFIWLERANLKWRICEGEMFGTEVLTLSEIAEQLKNETNMITIFIDGPFSGTILQYGNYGDSWYEIGTTYGYA